MQASHLSVCLVPVLILATEFGESHGILPPCLESLRPAHSRLEYMFGNVSAFSDPEGPEVLGL